VSKVYTDFANDEALSKSNTIQTSPILGRESEMSLNNAGGYSFTLDQWGVLDRFIMIGTEGGNYYTSQRDITAQSFTNVIACIKDDGVRAIQRAVLYSTSGRAPKNDAALVVLALAAVHGTAEVQAEAYAALPKVARIGTHLFTFVSILNSLGKWNAAAKRGLSAWYTNRHIDKLAVQLLKYQSRNGWSHRDVLRLAHVKPKTPEQDALFHWVTKDHARKVDIALPALVESFEALHSSNASVKDILKLISDNSSISWEMVPTQFLNNRDVLMALLPSMGLTAVIRQLGKLTAAGVIAPLSKGNALVIDKLSSIDNLKSSKIHPISVLQAFKQYQIGHGNKGSLVWKPNQRVLDVLDSAFYSTFENSTDTKAGYFLGVDCSGSMFGSVVNGSPNLNAAEVAACLAMGIVKNQSNYWIGGFNNKMSELKISPNMRLDAVLKTMEKFNWGSTNCALPMEHALEHKMDNVDAFITITDNETYVGKQHPVQALKKYRNKYVKSAKCVVIGTSVSEFTIADPKDGGMLDIAGFDSAVPAIIADLVYQR
jgi:60 kDa SS-A/Ro ribonucleoprotein